MDSAFPTLRSGRFFKPRAVRHFGRSAEGPKGPGGPGPPGRLDPDPGSSDSGPGPADAGDGPPADPAGGRSHLGVRHRPGSRRHRTLPVGGPLGQLLLPNCRTAIIIVKLPFCPFFRLSRAVRFVKTRMDSAFSTLRGGRFFKPRAVRQRVQKTLGCPWPIQGSIGLSADQPIGCQFEKSCFPGDGKGRSGTILTG